ncbi:hypothetical protein VUN84_00910 [Micrococcaceae bacterium Sec5.8]
MVLAPRIVVLLAAALHGHRPSAPHRTARRPLLVLVFRALAPLTA